MNDVWVIFDLLLTDKENGYHNSNKMHWDERSISNTIEILKCINFGWSFRV